MSDSSGEFLKIENELKKQLETICTAVWIQNCVKLLIYVYK